MSHVSSTITRVLGGDVLSADDDAVFRQHLRTCERCRGEYDEAASVLRLARGHVDAAAPGELERMTKRATRLAKPEVAQRFAWRYAFVGAALAMALVLTVMWWPKRPVGTVLVASRGLLLDGVAVGKDAVIYEDTVITTGKEDAAILLEGAKGRRGLLLRPNTRVRAASSDEVSLVGGRVRVQITKSTAPFMVRVDGARVVQSQPGVFAVETRPTGALVAVHHGSVQVSARGGSVEVKEGQQTDVVDGTPSASKGATASALIEDRGNGSVWDAILRFLKQLVDAIARALE